jgi:hypothetical protein
MLEASLSPRPPSAAASSVTARCVLAGAVVAAGLVAYLNVRPDQVWLLWLTAALAALAVDGIVRSNRQWQSRGALDSIAYLFLPFIAVLGIGLFVDHAVEGFARVAIGLAGGAAVGVVAIGEHHSVDSDARAFGAMRLLLAVATYLAAFAMYTAVFARDLDVSTGSVVVGVVSMALAMELLREDRIVGPSSVLAGLAIGISLAELRLALYFFPLDDLLAGALLIIGFYLATGLVHHLLDHDLTLPTLLEYLLVAGVGSAAVVVTRSVT